MENKRKMIFLSVILIAMIFFSGLNLFGSRLNVYDNAALFSESELEALDKKAADLSEKLKVDIVILTISDNQDKTVGDYAGDFYNQNGLGYGTDKKGILLLFDMDGEQLHVSSFNINLTDSINKMFKSMNDKMVESFGNGGSYYEAAIIFLDTIESYDNGSLQMDNNTVSEKDTGVRERIIAYLFTAILFGGMIVGFMVPIMDHTYTNEVNTSLEVDNYLENNALNIVDKQDRHINTQLVSKEI